MSLELGEREAEGLQSLLASLDEALFELHLQLNFADL